MSLPLFKALLSTGCGCIGAALLMLGDAVPDGATIGSLAECALIGFVVCGSGSWCWTSIVLGIAGHKQQVDDTTERPAAGRVTVDTSSVTLQFLAPRRRGNAIEEIAERVGVWRGPK